MSLDRLEDLNGKTLLHIIEHRSGKEVYTDQYNECSFRGKIKAQFKSHGL